MSSDRKWITFADAWKPLKLNVPPCQPPRSHLMFNASIEPTAWYCPYTGCHIHSIELREMLWITRTACPQIGYYDNFTDGNWIETRRPGVFMQSIANSTQTYSVESMSKILQNHLYCPQVYSFNCHDSIKTLRAPAVAPESTFQYRKSHKPFKLTELAHSRTHTSLY